jgi:hypothetical protein
MRCAPGLVLAIAPGWVLACSSAQPPVVAPTTGEKPCICVCQPTATPQAPAPFTPAPAAWSAPSSAAGSSGGPQASPSAATVVSALPGLAQGTCPWGQPSAVPQPSPLAQQVCAGQVGVGPAHFVQGLPLPQRMFFARAHVEGFERTLDVLRRHNTPPGNAIRMLAESYAELECLEADLCATASTPGSASDLAAANAARQRMDDLCADLRQLPKYVRQCP